MNQENTELTILPDDDPAFVSNDQLVKLSNLNEIEVKEQVEMIQRILRSVMIEGIHYGKIPGINKDILLKPGAEKIGLTFRLIPRYEFQRISSDNGHCEYVVTCSLYHLTGTFVGQGLGSCSTMESKYRYRKAERVCPDCGAPAIIKGRAEYGGGWVCYKKKNGCGAKYQDEDERITGQKTGKVENADIADQYNTIIKMAKKRAHVDAILTATAASDIFTQDLEPSNIQTKTPPIDEKEILKQEIRKLLQTEHNGEKIFPEGLIAETIKKVNVYKLTETRLVEIKQSLQIKIAAVKEEKDTTIDGQEILF